MPVNGGVIGCIVNRGLGSFLWQISEFSGLPKKKGNWYFSPYIHMAEAEWFLVIYRSGTKEFPDRLLLELRRWDGEPAKTFHCTVGVRRADGEEEQVGTQTVRIGKGYTPWILFPLCRREEERKFLSSDTLTLTLRIKEEGEATSQGGLLNPEVTRMECSNSRGQTQNDPTEEESSSSEAKDGTSQETEREGFEYTTDKVNDDRKDDCTSPEARGVMLLTKHMGELLKSDDCDVRFRVQKKEFPAHRNILKARCPVFRMMLTHDTQENQSGIIRIEDCDADAFEIFLMYVYSGKAKDLTPQKALNLYYIADKYDFSELKEQCVALLKRSLSKTTVCDAILLSVKHDESELMEAATNFFVRNIKKIVLTVEWQKFMIEHPIEGNELYIKYLNIQDNSDSE